MPASTATSRRLAWLAIGVLFGLVLLLALPEPARRPAASTTPDAEPGAATDEAVSPIDASDPTDAPATATATAPVGPGTRAVQLDQDLHALARALLPAAEAGEASAQFELATVLQACDGEVQRFADRAEFDAYLETLPRRSGVDPVAYPELQRSRYEACDGFRTDPLAGFGASAEWLVRAAAGGEPLAQLQELTRGDRLGDADRESLRAAAQAALASGRPEAYMQLLELEFPEHDSAESRDATPHAAAWWLLACARGYPCGPEARWRREQLAFRGSPRPETGWEDALLFDLPAHERTLARERAAELERLIAVGELEAVLPLSVR